MIAKGVNVVAVTLFGVMIICCVVQVFTRYILNDSPRWTEELARYTFIWVHFLGATICVRMSSNATITVLIDQLRGLPRRVFDGFVTLVMTVVGVVMVYGGVEMAQRTHKQLSVGVKMPMSFVYVSAAFFGAIVVLYAVTMLLENITAGGRTAGAAEKGAES